MSCCPAKSLTRELESVTRQSRLGKHLQRWRLRLSHRLGEDLSGLTQLSRELVHGKYPGPGPTRSHQSGNHLTNRHCQPPPTRGSALSSPRLEEAQIEAATGPDATQPWPAVEGSGNCHLIVNFDARNSNFPFVAPWLSIFPRGAARVCPGGQLVPSARPLSATAQSWELSSPTVKYKPVPLPGGGG